jgi:hypothetical protein
MFNITKILINKNELMNNIYSKIETFINNSNDKYNKDKFITSIKYKMILKIPIYNINILSLTTIITYPRDEYMYIEISLQDDKCSIDKVIQFKIEQNSLYEYLNTDCAEIIYCIKQILLTKTETLLNMEINFHLILVCNDNDNMLITADNYHYVEEHNNT